MAVTIWDIAKHLGLSVSTISRALNDYNDVAPETRQRVFDAARELGYYPSATARNLRRGRSDKIGLLINTSVTYISDYLAELIPATTLAAEKQNHNLILYTTTITEPDGLARVCRAREVDGFILLWAGQMDETIAFLQQDGMPFVVLNRRVDNPDVSFVAADNLNGALTLMRHLIALGHRRIGFTARPALGETNVDRLAGYKQALAEAGIPFDENLVISTVVEPRSGYYATNQLLDLPEPPTAIFAIHDLVAIDVLEAAVERGWRVPDDLAIASFDGLRASLLANPPITTAKVPIAEIGRRAVEILLAQAEDDNRPPARITLPVQFMVRESTAGRDGTRIYTDKH